MYQNSRLDYLRAQSLAQKMAMQPVQNPYNMMYNPQLADQPVQSMLKPKYTSNMMGTRGLYSGAIRGYAGGTVQ